MHLAMDIFIRKYSEYTASALLEDDDETLEDVADLIQRWEDEATSFVDITGFENTMDHDMFQRRCQELVEAVEDVDAAEKGEVRDFLLVNPGYDEYVRLPALARVIFDF